MKSAVVSIACNEQNYLQEWIDYHRKLGFTDIFVFQNNWRFESKNVQCENVHIMEYDGPAAQNKCYNDFIEQHYREYDFLLFIDIDEFLDIKKFSGLDDFLNEYVDENIVFLNWRMYGDSGIKETTDGDWSCLKRFTMCDSVQHRLGKSLLNMRKCGNCVRFNNPHITILNGRIVPYSDTNHKRILKIWDVQPQDEQKAELAHFQGKTWSEYIYRKYLKHDAVFGWGNRLNNDLRYLRQVFEENNKNIIKNERMRDFLYGN